MKAVKELFEQNEGREKSSFVGEGYPGNYLDKWKK